MQRLPRDSTANVSRIWLTLIGWVESVEAADPPCPQLVFRRSVPNLCSGGRLQRSDHAFE